MASVVGICNEALGLLGAASITALTDTSTEAVLCNRYYETCLDFVIRDGDWNSARAEAALSPLTGTPVIGWSYKYTLPADPYCLRVLRVESSGSLVEWETRGRELFCDYSGINLLYSKRITDPNDFDSMLYQCVVFRLAYMLAYAIRRESGFQKDLLREYELAKDAAMGIDAQEGYAKYQAPVDQPLASRDLIDARLTA